MTIKGLILRASLISRRQMHVISRSITNVKPDSPTPLNLKHYKLPSHDRMNPNIYMPLVLFYSNPQPSDYTTSIANLLKISLSKTLSKYYPFAGRLGSSGSYVECSDQGINFLEVQIACNLSEILEKAPVKDEEEGFGHLFPPCSIWDKVSSSPLVLVQLNHCSCGGIAIAVCLSHRIADASTLLSFLSYWASVSRNPGDVENLAQLAPCFVQGLLPNSYDDGFVATDILISEKNWITAEMLFYNSKIAELKAYQEKQDKLHGVVANQNYTRNELVTALLYRCALAAAATSNSGAYPLSVLFQAINMRRLIDPPLPKTSVGNLMSPTHISANTMNETELHSLIGQMRKEKKQLTGIKSLVRKGFLQLIEKYAKDNYKLYVVSSICNFPLYDRLDFGWGRPVNASVVDAPAVNIFTMMDTPNGDGIKVILGLEKEDMKNFRADKELITYASFYH
ncbi:acyltransferase-like [Apium graveolens]|uniref:acyltransferase-like n=1 Tax=Apium graveolens TaxID=4045 RepID=UPI003D7AC23E